MSANEEIRRSIVIPYFNELKRFPLNTFVENAKEMSSTTFILVDDGSTDGLTPLIKEFLIVHEMNNIVILVQEQNLGKAAALHAGFTYSTTIGSSEIGFLDADFSTSLVEIQRLFDIMNSTNANAVIGSRQTTSDNFIKVDWHRLLAGKLFSAFVRFYFQINLIDTQCGAKVFKVNETLLKSLEQPIINPWLYDLQLLIPIIKKGGSVAEVVLKEWKNGSESKFNLYKGVIALFKLRQIKVAVDMSIRRS
jgi:glycosyltransferase involved in cell wall biosynthesis